MGQASLRPRPLMRPSEAVGFSLVDCCGVEFAVGGVYDGVVVVYVEREMVSGHSIDVALDHWVVAYFFVLVGFDVLALSTIFICVIFFIRNVYGMGAFSRWSIALSAGWPCGDFIYFKGVTARRVLSPCMST